MIHPIAYIVIYEDGKFLLVQRRADHDDFAEYDKKWQLPGTELLPDEDLRSAIRREAKEELGVDVDLKRTLAMTEMLTPGTGWNGVAMAFLCKRLDPTQPVVINIESHAYGWYTLDEAKKLDLMPHMADILEYVAVHYRLFKVGAISVIQHEDKYLLTKSHAPDKQRIHSKWGFVSGTCDLYESLQQTVHREVKEEIGHEVEIIRRAFYMIEIYDLKLFCFLVKLTDPTAPVSLHHTSSEYGWYTIDEMRTLDLYPDTLEIISHL